MAKAPKPQKTTGRPKIVITVDGDEVVYDHDAVTSDDVAELRKATGFGSRAIFDALFDDKAPGLDLDLMAGLVFLALRQSDQRLTWAKATRGITGATNFELEIRRDADDDEVDVDDPKV